MAGGLFNIIAIGNANIFLTGNPTKTFFKVVYSKYTNFGLQKFRIDYEGLRDLRLTDKSTFTFKIPRYAELLMDTYVVVNIPDIWSPIYNPTSDTNYQWSAYEFKWIKNLGSNMIKEIIISCGSQIIQKYSGSYINAMVERDFTSEKKQLFNEMTGNIDELNNPSNCNEHLNVYPNALYTANTNGAEPSIRGRQLFIPINSWFSLDNRCAFPLVSLQYNELYITITLRPIQELFQVRDVFDFVNGNPYIQPDFNKSEFQLYRFLQTPPSYIIDNSIMDTVYTNKNTSWNADVHLISTYCFLSNDESKLFAQEDQIYLIKDIIEYNYTNISGTKKIKVYTSGMVSNWMFYFQRNDVNLRNEWSNYSNYPYSVKPSILKSCPEQLIYNEEYINGPLYNIDGTITGYNYTGDYNIENIKNILLTMGILFNGDYRENVFTEGIYNYIEKYVRTNGYAKNGIYCYNFCLNTNPFVYQPSGAINMTKFKTIELEISTIIPNLDLVNSNFNTFCDSDGNIIGYTKQNWQLYEYCYNMTLFEERYNILSFIGGNCGMMNAK